MGEASRGGFVETALDDCAKVAVAAAPLGHGRRRRRHERANTSPRFQQTCALEVGVHAGNSVGVDGQIDRKLTDGRQLEAWRQAAGRDRGPQRVVDLGIDRRRMPMVQGKEPSHNPIVLVL